MLGLCILWHLCFRTHTYLSLIFHWMFCLWPPKQYWRAIARQIHYTCDTNKEAQKKALMSLPSGGEGIRMDEVHIFKVRITCTKTLHLVGSIVFTVVREVVIKSGYFTARSTLRGGISTLGPDRKQMWKLWPIFFIEFCFFNTQNTFYLIVRGLKNALFMSWMTLLHHYSTILQQSSSKQWGALIIGQFCHLDQSSYFLV